MSTIAILLIIGTYFLPFWIALLKWRRNLAAIFALNLLLGWTLLGWIGALIWSLTEGQRYNSI